MSDEEKLLFLKAKIEWLSKGNKKNKYVHKFIKRMKHSNGINTIYNEAGVRSEGNMVVEQMVNEVTDKEIKE